MWDMFVLLVLKLLYSIMGLVILLEIVWKLVCMYWIFFFFGGGGEFVVSNTSLNKSSWNNWVVLKRTDRCQLFLSPG